MSDAEFPIIDTPCREKPDRWFLTGKDACATAADACRTRCDFRDACLEAALDFEGSLMPAGRYGVWAGTTPEERFEISMTRRFKVAR